MLMLLVVDVPDEACEKDLDTELLAKVLTSGGLIAGAALHSTYAGLWRGMLSAIAHPEDRAVLLALAATKGILAVAEADLDAKLRNSLTTDS